MKTEKTNNMIFFTILLIIGILFLTGIIFLSVDLRKIFSSILIVSSGATMVLRSYKLENYLLLLDKKPKIKLFKHYFGMLINFDKLAAFSIPRLVFEKSEFEIERKQINLITYLIYILLICGIILQMIE